jgi:CRP-like cAMP-binding protein
MVDEVATDVSLKKRTHLITALPCFSMLTSDESTELANLMTAAHFAVGDAIVTEEELVDRVFIIVSGHAEVSHQVKVKKSLKKKTISQPLALIGPGDAIGLNDTGFFSDTGKRTATVIATVPLIALSLDLKHCMLLRRKCYVSD